MNHHPHITSKKCQFDDKKYQLSICDNPMECPECSSLIYLKQKMEIKDIISEVKEKIPFEISRIEILIPIQNNKKYYSFEGVEEIIEDLFDTEIQSIENELSEIDTYLKVYLVSNELYKIPQVKIEILFFHKMSDETFDFLFKFLNNKLFDLIGNSGVIERINISHKIKLEKLLYIPMLLGHPEIKKEGVYNSLDFLQYHLKELNYFFTTTIIKLDNKEKIKKPFDDLRMVMFLEQREKEQNEKIDREIRKLILEEKIEIENGDLDEIRYIVFDKNEEEDDDFPF